jgi:hypothetical protein
VAERKLEIYRSLTAIVPVAPNLDHYLAANRTQIPSQGKMNRGGRSSVSLIIAYVEGNFRCGFVSSCWH